MSDFIQNWDDPSHGATWDSGLQWDVNIGPEIGSVAPYLALVTSEHNQQPNFMRMLGGVFQPLADIMSLMQSLAGIYDVDEAVGAQLDAVGLWVGASRRIAAPLTNVYFTFDSTSLGFDSGAWYSTFNPISGIVTLDDEAFRSFIRGRIVNNAWDGTIPGAYAVWDAAFAGTGIGLLIQDLGNMHMIMALTGPVPDAVTLALFTGGYLNVKPAGVQIDAFVTPTVQNVPYFGFDAETGAVSGFDVGAFGNHS